MPVAPQDPEMNGGTIFCWVSTFAHVKYLKSIGYQINLLGALALLHEPRNCGVTEVGFRLTS